MKTPPPVLPLTTQSTRLPLAKLKTPAALVAELSQIWLPVIENVLPKLYDASAVTAKVSPEIVVPAMVGAPRLKIPPAPLGGTGAASCR